MTSDSSRQLNLADFLIIRLSPVYCVHLNPRLVKSLLWRRKWGGRAPSHKYNIHFSKYQIHHPKYKIHHTKYPIHYHKYQKYHPNYNIHHPNYKIHNPKYKIPDSKSIMCIIQSVVTSIAGGGEKWWMRKVVHLHQFAPIVPPDL